MRMPEPDQAVIAAAPEIVADLRRLVPGESVIADLDARRAYETDGLTAYRQPPLAVVLPTTVWAQFQLHGGGIKKACTSLRRCAGHCSTTTSVGCVVDSDCTPLARCPACRASAFAPSHVRRAGSQSHL